MGIRDPLDLSCGQIDRLAARVLEGGEVQEAEALWMIGLEDPGTIRYLARAAHRITIRFNGKTPRLCSLVNAKSHLCGEDCAFCSQSARYRTEAEPYSLMSAEAVLEHAKKLEAAGTRDFCVVTSGRELSESEFEKVLGIFRLLRKETRLHLDGSLGFLTRDRAKRLKEAGLRRYNNNLQTSERFYPRIVSTHSHAKRRETLEILREEGIEICAGGILGMGESREDRVRLAFEIKPYAPHCLPINILNPRPGTPLEGRSKEDFLEILKTIAVFRFVHPRANIKLAGGREYNLSPSEQEEALQGGANGMITGGYLTTEGNEVSDDLRMLIRIGYEPEGLEALGLSPSAKLP
ncbi:MAG: biotin synthase BioB [Candidatus Omnitrophota bacterium]